MLNDFLIRRPGQSLIASLQDDQVLQHPDLSARDASDADGDTGGGDDAATDDAATDDSQAQDDTDDASDADSGDDDDAADDDESDEDEDEAADGKKEAYATPRERKLANALKKAKGKLRGARGVTDTLKKLEEQGVELTDLVLSHRQLANLNEAARKNPKLHALLYGSAEDADDTGTRGSSTRKAADDTFVFDDSKEALGFDKDLTTANKRLAAGLRDAAETRFLLNQLLKQVGGNAIEQRVTNIVQTNAKQAAYDWEWKSRSDAALATVQKSSVRKLLSDALKGAYQHGLRNNRTAQFYIDWYLKDLEKDGLVTKREAAQVSAAAKDAKGGSGTSRSAAQAANKVAQLPRQHVTGSPAPAKNKLETLADVRKRIARTTSA